VKRDCNHKSGWTRAEPVAAHIHQRSAAQGSTQQQALIGCRTARKGGGRRRVSEAEHRCAYLPRDEGPTAQQQGLLAEPAGAKAEVRPR